MSLAPDSLAAFFVFVQVPLGSPPIHPPPPQPSRGVGGGGAAAERGQAERDGGHEPGAGAAAGPGVGEGGVRRPTAGALLQARLKFPLCNVHEGCCRHS